MSKCKSLMLSQLLRLLRSGDTKSMGHIGYWIGEVLGDIVPGLDGGAHAGDTPDYFAHLEFLVVEGKAAGLVSVGSWRQLTNKMIYKVHAKDFPDPKVVVDSGVSYKAVWRSLSSPVLTSVARDVVFLLIHNKLPVRERLFRIGLATDPYCEVCLAAIVCDVEHFFCSCSRVWEVWGWVRSKIVGLLGAESAAISNWELINLFFPRSNSEKEVVWITGMYIAKAWEDLFIRSGEKLKAEQFFGFLRFKYRAAQLGARLPLNVIPGLFE